MQCRLIAFAACVAACGSKDSAPVGQAARAEPTPAAMPVERAPAAPPQPLDDKAAELLAAAPNCELVNGRLPDDCAPHQVLRDYAFNKQNNADVAATCASKLRNAPPQTRFLAAACLDRMTSRAVTPHLGAALDAIETERDDALRSHIAWSLRNAEAVTAKLDARVMKLVEKYAAMPDGEDTAGALLATLFPSYMIGEAPKPPAAAQAFVLAAVARKPGTVLIRSLEYVKSVDDKAAACSAVAAVIREDNPEWWRAAHTIAELGAKCQPDLAAIMDVALATLAKGAGNVDVMLRLDRKFELAPALRKKVAAGIQRAVKAQPDWKRKDVAAAAKAFRGPRPEPT